MKFSLSSLKGAVPSMAVPSSVVPSKKIVLGVLFLVFLAFILYSLMNKNPFEGFGVKKNDKKDKPSPTTPMKKA
jgi:hypothetical protein